MIRSTSFCILFALTLMMAPMSFAQQPTDCMTNPRFADFDFWLGSWQVTPFAGGEKSGDNVISRVEGGCAVEEHWTSVNGSTGRSLNYFNPVTGKWRQIWVSAGAYSIDIEGGLEGGIMSLEGSIFYYAGAAGPNATALPFRGEWTPQPDGTVRQRFEQYDPEAGAWTVWFDGLYTRSLMPAEQ